MLCCGAGTSGIAARACFLGTLHNHVFHSMIAGQCEEVQSAVAQTEASVQEAQKVINEARLFVSTKSAVVRKFKSSTASAQANAIILQLQKQLQEAGI